MDRLVQHNVLAMSGRAVEAAGDVDTLLLDKTGTITLGNRQATEFLPVAGRHRARRWPTRRSWRRWPTRRPRAARSSCWPRRSTGSAAASWPTTRRRSCRSRRRRACRASTSTAARSARARPTPIERLRRRATAARLPPELQAIVERIARAGGTPLVVAENGRALGVDPPEGHRQGRHARALRAPAGDGHQDRDDHRRQPADRAPRSPPRPASTTSWRRRRRRTRWR